MKDYAQEKKDYLIYLLKKYGEYDESIDRENMDPISIDEIYNVLLTGDEEKRNEIINSYKKREIDNIKKQRKDAEEFLLKVKKFSNKIKEKKSDIKDSKEVQDLEDQILHIDD